MGPQNERLEPMKLVNCLLLAMLFLAFLFAPYPGSAQTGSQQSKSTNAAAAPAADDQTKNIDAYIALMRREVQQEKSEIMGSVMALNAQDAAKFWPIYSAYDEELTKLNDMRTANIKEYARTYNEMTNEKADELIQKSLDFQKQRSELLAKTYQRVKEALGAVNAARFVQVEYQLLLLIDLKIASSLPVVGSGS